MLKGKYRSIRKIREKKRTRGSLKIKEQDIEES
jgi:hypothetical protein